MLKSFRSLGSFRSSLRAGLVLLLCVGALGAGARSSRGEAAAGMADYSGALVIAPPGLSKPEQKAVEMLVDEVQRRSRLRWDVAEAWDDEEAKPKIIVGSRDTLKPLAETVGEGPGSAEDGDRPEGFRIWTVKDRPTVVVEGNDARGVLFGVGRLLRELRMDRDRVLLPESLSIVTAPRFPLRGQQLGYRPKTNSYDGWDLDQWERYIRDLAVFGTNTIELIPPVSDDDPDSPHFPRPQLEMMIGMSRILDEYGLNVSVWHPAMKEGADNPKIVEATLAQWREVLGALPRVNAVLVPGGDPGRSHPRDLFPFLEKAAAVVREYHPGAEMWVSPQGFNQEWLDAFRDLLKEEPEWLTGVVYGPHIRVSLEEIRALTPRRYPIRLYPDITHTMKSQHPVPDWDLAFWMTQGREPINPRPADNAVIFRAMAPGTPGFVTYSEGCNDDVNKIVWAALGWDPDAAVAETLREYARYFIGPRYENGFALGLQNLERNWRGPALGNESIETTLAQFQDMERAAAPRDLLNWRFQQGLYRAYYDADVKDRLGYETQLESQARERLRNAPRIGSIEALKLARAELTKATTKPVSADRRARVLELGEALFQSIHMQLSVPKYQAIGVDRGANLDLIDAPLNNREWLERSFTDIEAMEKESDRLKAIDALLRRTCPGPGGFYDELGDPRRRPHLVPGPSLAEDPMLWVNRTGFHQRPGWPLAWRHTAESLYGAPLRMRYDELDPKTPYRIRVVYSGENQSLRIRLEADGVEIHPLIPKPDPTEPFEADLPPEITADGRLELTWTPEPGQGSNGRGCQVAEVWLAPAR